MITVEGLTKRYSGTTVVDRVSFSCEPGTITGLLGPNGAGKSTTLRMILGLTAPDAGRATIGGRPFATLPNPATHVGALLDASAMHPGRTGRNTLRTAATVVGAPAARIQELLTLVGLAGPAAKKRVGTYSLGMRQRLGLAQALIGHPSVLVLDEPANGLDPEGIVWMRRFLRSFADDGGTVLVSSHLLAEVEATVDRLVVVGAGRVVGQGVLAEMLAGSGLVVRSTNQEGLLRMLTAEGLQHAVGDDGAVTITGEGVTAEGVARAAVAAGVLLTELRPSNRTGLEQLFFQLTRTTGTHATLEGAR